MSDDGSGNGLFGRVRSRLAVRTADEAAAADLRDDSKKTGATPVAEVRPGESVTVCGTIRSLTLRPRGGAPALEAELYDGSGSILLIWLGRRQIVGVDPGRGIIVHGRATQGRDSLVVYNAGYELRPTAHE